MISFSWHSIYVGNGKITLIRGHHIHILYDVEVAIDVVDLSIAASTGRVENLLSSL